MNLKIAEMIFEAKKIAEDSVQTFGHLNGEQINWKPDEKTWSVGQCFEHLIVTNELYFPNIEKVADGTHRNNFFSKIPFSTNLIAAVMKNALKPEQARKMKTFKIFEPAASNVSEHIIENFAENNRKLIEMMKAVEEFEIDKIKIAEPLSITLNLRLDDAFEILMIHEKRHFLQAERIKTLENFPR